MRPIRTSYRDETGVEVEIIAGMSAPPPEDLSPPERRPETDYYGWFVLCNDRVVIASDKSNKTVWGDDGFPVWHYQYNGFLGVVSFHSRDAKLLPWTTTKRDIDTSNMVYRRAVAKMKEISRTWISYTNERKDDVEVAKVHEAAATMRSLFTVDQQPNLVLPRVLTRPKVEVTTISYSKPKLEVAKVKEALGNRNMANKDAGIKTFEYFMKHEISE